MMQNVVAEDRPDMGLSVVVLRTADRKAEILRVLAPLGVLLPTGLGLNVDGKDIGRAYFVRCFADGCYAEVILEKPLLDTLKTGKAATFIVFQTPEEGIGIPVDLKGFGEALPPCPSRFDAMAMPAAVPMPAPATRTRCRRMNRRPIRVACDPVDASPRLACGSIARVQLADDVLYLLRFRHGALRCVPH